MQKVGQHFKRSLRSALMLLCLKQNRTATTLSSSPSAKHDDWLSEWLSLSSLSLCTHAMEEASSCLTERRRACLCMYICRAQRGLAERGHLMGHLSCANRVLSGKSALYICRPLSDIKTKHAASSWRKVDIFGYTQIFICTLFSKRACMCTLTLMVKDFALSFERSLELRSNAKFSRGTTSSVVLIEATKRFKDLLKHFIIY